MASFTFVHAADLHLGAPFRGLDRSAAETFAQGGSAAKTSPSGRLLTEASFTALERLEQLCLAEKADFLLLAGDIYDDEDGVLRARFALRDMFARLGEAGLRVFIAHGNHDPLPSGPLPLAWPDNVTVFGPAPHSEAVRRNGEILALVHGVSHTNSKEKNNLAKRFARKMPDLLSPDLTAGVFQIGLLHCCVGTAEGHAPYAPCSLTDLTGTGLDYWALGHVHQGRTLSAGPLVLYPGSVQGLHINESGPHGCVLVRVEDGKCAVRNVPLAPVCWRKLTLDLDACASSVNLDALEQTILSSLDEAAREAGEKDRPAGPFFPPAALFCRVVLAGSTDLDRVLRRPDSLETLLERLRDALARTAPDAGLPKVWLKDLVLRTSPALDFAALAKREDLVGEVARLAGQAGGDPETLRALAESALSDLYGHRRLKKALDAPLDEELREILSTARSLCCSLLESD